MPEKDEQVHSQLQRGFEDGILLLVAKDYALFEELETVARITAMRHAIITDPRVKALQVTWLKKMVTRRSDKNAHFMEAFNSADPLPLTPEQKAEFHKKFNTQGIISGRFRSDRPNLSNLPRSLEETMETVMGDTIVKTAPDLVEIKCGDSKDGCQQCGEKRKDQVRGKRAEVVKKNPGGNTRVKIMEGEKQGEHANCPPERLKPVRAEKIVDEPPPPEPEPAKPEMRNYGYGLACSNCRATKGECHASSCPHAGSTV